MKKFLKKIREAVKRTLNKVSEFRHQSSIEILGPHSRLQTVRFAAMAPQIQRQYKQPIGSCRKAPSRCHQPFADYSPFNGI
jgi:hypothetical protein